MQLTESQVLALAPDSGSANNGKKLANAKHWPLLGKSGRALWGECQGSGSKPYQVRVDAADFASKCSCPSFKFPCKHALGLLMLTAQQPQLLVDATEPEWVSNWLDKRSETAEHKQARAEAKAAAPVDEAAQRKRAQKRDTRVQDGLSAFDIWLQDLVRNGLARLPGEGSAVWEQQAARLVDAQVSGLAARVRALADVPGSTPDWPAAVLAELGRWSLAIRAYGQIDTLPAPLQSTLRQYLGSTVREDEVLAHGDVQADCWHVIGQTRNNDDRVRVLRTWLMGQCSQRPALLLQFAVGAQNFEAAPVPGTAFDAELAYWPGAAPLRALIKSKATPAPSPQGFAGALVSVPELLERWAQTLALNPWQDSIPVLLQGITPVAQPGADGPRWLAADAQGLALPLAGNAPWRWLALTGGQPQPLAAQWDGRALRPLGLFGHGTTFYPL